MKLSVLEGSGKTTCKICKRVVSRKSLPHHLRLIRQIKFSNGKVRDVLADSTYGRSRYCDGSPAGVAAHRRTEELRLPVMQLHDVWEQAADLMFGSGLEQAAAFARRALGALAAAGIRPREKKGQRR